MKKKPTKFQKQIIVLCCLLLAAAACFAVYLVRSSAEKGDGGEELPYAFSDKETEAIRAFGGDAAFAFKAEKGGADAKTAPLMRLAEGYSALNGRIKVRYGSGGADCALTVNGKESVADMDALFKTLDDGTPYATDARAFFNTALFGDALGAGTDALDGFDLDGDRVNSAGFAYLYGPVERDDIKYINVVNEYDELTFIPLNGVFYLADTSMDLSTAVSSTLVAAVRAPVAAGKVQDPGDLSEYGLGEGQKETATVLMEDNDGNGYYLRIGKRLTDGSGYYAVCYGKDTVYILPSSISNYILVPKESFLVANYGTPLEQLTDVFHKIDDIVINFGDDIFRAELMSDTEKQNHAVNYTWKVTAPGRFVSKAYGYALPDYGVLGDLFNALCALSTEDVEEADVDDAALQKYGLDEPDRSYSWLYDGTTRCTVYFSKPNGDGDYYVYSVKEQVKTGEKATVGIGVVDGASFAYGGYKLTDYLDSSLYVQYFDRLDGMEFTRNGESYRVTLEKDDEGVVQTARLNGEEVDLTSCKNFYRGLLHCSVLEEYEGDAPAETFSLSVTSGGKTVSFTFGRVSSMKAYCAVDGKAGYVMDYELYETLVTGADKLIAGEKIEW